MGPNTCASALDMKGRARFIIVADWITNHEKRRNVIRFEEGKESPVVITNLLSFWSHLRRKGHLSAESTISAKCLINQASHLRVVGLSPSGTESGRRQADGGRGRRAQSAKKVSPSHKPPASCHKSNMEWRRVETGSKYNVSYYCFSLKFQVNSPQIKILVDWLHRKNIRFRFHLH